MDVHIETITNMLASMQGNPSYGVLASLWHDRGMNENILLDALDELLEMGCVCEYVEAGTSYYRLT